MDKIRKTVWLDANIHDRIETLALELSNTDEVTVAQMYRTLVAEAIATRRDVCSRIGHRRSRTVCRHCGEPTSPGA